MSLKSGPVERGRAFFPHLVLELKSHARMAVSPPARREQILQALRMLRLNRQAMLYGLRAYNDEAPMRAVLEQRPLSAFPRVRGAIWLHYKCLAPSFGRDPRPAAALQPARQAYDLARRGKPEAALRKLDALIAALKSGSPGLSPVWRDQLLLDAHLLAGAVGYMVSDETAGAYYTAACELAPRNKGALLVLGAIFLRLGRTDEARATWARALQVERDNYAGEESGPGTPGRRESLQDAKVRLEATEAMVASLDER